MSVRFALALVAGLLATSAQAAPAKPVYLSSLWTLSGLEDPESVAISGDKTFFYVANVVGEGDAVDGRGYVSRISRDGKMLQRDWVTGLNAPKGVIVAGDRLYLSDITHLVAIDTTTARVVGRYEAPGAKFLNDVAVTPAGTVLAADSATGRIFALADGRVSVWAEDAHLRAINGLLPEKSRLVITTMDGKLLAMDYATKAVTVLADGLGNGDGVARVKGGGYLVSEWPGRLYTVSSDGSTETLIDSRKAGTYINDFIRVGDQLIVPSWKPGTLTAYRIRD